MKTIQQEIIKNLLFGNSYSQSGSNFGECEKEHTLQNQCMMKS